MAGAIAGTIFEDSSCSILARIVNGANELIEQADISTIHRDSWDISTTPPTRKAGPTSLTVANVIFNTLQTGGAWVEDSEGYNFLDLIPASAMPATTLAQWPLQKAARIEYKVVLTSGEYLKVIAEPKVLPSLYGK